MICETTYNDDGSVAFRTEYSYDAQGNRIQEMECDENGVSTNWYRIDQFYDAQGNMVKWIDYYGDVINSYGENSYDEQGNLTKEVEYGKEGWMFGGESEFKVIQSNEYFYE